ncbi:MAG TPA: M20/M25/M40 family metallo-hydrolase [Gemmatimonadales bacterium]|nr:M20/M25/M40 family metallo-hydrolase [Gemmatimonadales bacterium]
MKASPLAIGSIALALVVVAARGHDPVRPHTGFSPRSAATEGAIEHRLLSSADAARARIMTRDLAAQPHMAGTPAQAAVRDYILDKFRSFGLEPWTKEYVLYLPQPEIVHAWLYASPSADGERLALAEPPVGPKGSASGPQPLPFNAFSGNGDVTAPVVYVNYGLSQDYHVLDSLGVTVRGSIVIARYGHSFRGIKVREAEERGAAGVVLYSDPRDDGYLRGEAYPDGPMRPLGGIQRGSVLNLNGDPTTPSEASIPGAHRLPEESLAVPHIPVVPMGYANARRVLSRLAETPLPGSWDGPGSLRFGVGPGPARLRLQVRAERGARAMHPAWDTFAMIRGRTFPDEWIVVGAHSDAWSPGAADNVSGTVTVLETARAFAALARDGARPARTVLFATWDAEEWGLMGSTEWVEELEDEVGAHVVAYINEDDVANGLRFGGTGSPSLKPFIRDLTRMVADPGGVGTVYDGWRRYAVADTQGPAIENPGGGSDFAVFAHHMGIPMMGVGFGGPSGVYHSVYDTYDWMARFGDPGFRAHRVVTQLVSLAVARLANAEILPFDYVAFGVEMRQLATDLSATIEGQAWPVSIVPLQSALTHFTDAARAFSAARDTALAAGLDSGRASQVNRWLMQVERRLTRPAGLAGRPWYRSLQFAPDVDNGYATMAFPSVGEAIRYADAASAEREVLDVAAHVDLARDAIERATAVLR